MRLFSLRQTTCSIFNHRQQFNNNQQHAADDSAISSLSTYNNRIAQARNFMDHDDDNPSGPSVPVAELRGHEHGPIHIVRFTGQSLLFNYSCPSFHHLSCFFVP